MLNLQTLPIKLVVDGSEPAEGAGRRKLFQRIAYSINGGDSVAYVECCAMGVDEPRIRCFITKTFGIDLAAKQTPQPFESFLNADGFQSSYCIGTANTSDGKAVHTLHSSHEPSFIKLMEASPELFHYDN